MRAVLIALAVLGTVLAMPVLAAATVALSWVLLPLGALWLGAKAYAHHTSPREQARRQREWLRLQALLGEHRG